MTHRPWRRRPIIGASVVLLFGLLAGCGGGGSDGPPRMHVSGSVTYKGAPVPGGFIIFSPDSKRGNSGPQGKARIEGGQYTTDVSGGKGVVSGPHSVRVFGTDGVPYVDDSGSEQQDGKPLFSPWATDVEFSEGQSTYDFQVTEKSQARK